MVAGQEPNATYADDMDSSVYDILRQRVPIQIAIWQKQFTMTQNPYWRN